jgi:hypothetical protein
MKDNAVLWFSSVYFLGVGVALVTGAFGKKSLLGDF